VVRMVDDTGAVANSYAYDEWGNLLSKSETVANPIRYAGEYQDDESGYYYLRARYYDPVYSRFVSRDTDEGKITNPLSLNLYAYCEENPVMGVDPTGHSGLMDNRKLNSQAAKNINSDNRARAAVTGLVEWTSNALDTEARADVVSGATSSIHPVESAQDVGEELVSKAERGLLKATEGAGKDVTKIEQQVTKDLRRTPDQQALHDLAKDAAKSAKKGNSITENEAKTLDEWAKEYNVSQHHQAYPGSGQHFPGGGYQDHTHIYNVHVPYGQ